MERSILIRVENKTEGGGAPPPLVILQKHARNFPTSDIVTFFSTINSEDKFDPDLHSLLAQ